MDKCREVNLKLNEKKMRLRMKERHCMGHVLCSKGLKVDPEKTRAITAMPTSTNASQVHTFWGCVTYLSKFLPQLTEIAGPPERTNQPAVGSMGMEGVLSTSYKSTETVSRYSFSAPL